MSALVEQRPQVSRHHEAAEIQPLVSVVIVCHNQAHFLAEAIESALAQSYCPFEVLVIDDGSTDHTAEVCARYAAVRYIRQSNQGLPSARNAGLYYSCGAYVTFLDADDRLLPSAVEAGVRCFAESPGSCFVFGEFQNIHADGSPAPTPPARQVGRQFYFQLLKGNYIGMHATVLYRWSDLVKAGGFDISLPACEDYALYLRMTRTAAIGRHRTVVAEYRQHEGSMSRDSGLMLRTVLRVLNHEREFLPDRRHLKALRAGIRAWQEHYGPLLIAQWKKQRSIRPLLTLMRLWPEGMLRGAGRVVARSVTGALPWWWRFGYKTRTEPISPKFGFDRGQPIDRFYIEQFLGEHGAAVRGNVLEIGDSTYTRRFGANKAVSSDVLHVDPGHPGVTVAADLANAPQIPSGSFDCIVLTQTLQYVYDVDAAIATLFRILRPGGALLVTAPGISQLCDEQPANDSWRFTGSSLKRLLGHHFGEQNVDVRTYGNVLAAVGLLEGLCAADLRTGDLEKRDARYPVIVAASARKPQ